MSCCASCGATEGEDIKLKTCTGCKSAKYCGVKCQKKHRSAHKKECKKRAAEIRDEILFRQPESSHLGDCPICCLPISLGLQSHKTMNCCTQTVCTGCALTNLRKEMEEGKVESCPFCRAPSDVSDEKIHKRWMARIEANDPAAMQCYGLHLRYEKGDPEGALTFTKLAAKLGDPNAHFELAFFHRTGDGVEKDDSKRIFHLEEASIRGHPYARFELGGIEFERCQLENGTIGEVAQMISNKSHLLHHLVRAIKHWIISAKLGCDKALTALKDMYKAGAIKKDEFATVLREYQAAVDATKSPQRQWALEFTQEVCPPVYRGK